MTLQHVDTPVRRIRGLPAPPVHSAPRMASSGGSTAGLIQPSVPETCHKARKANTSP